MEESKNKEKGLEEWLKLISEPLKPVEEKMVKREEYSGRKDWGLMGADEEEKENYQYGRKLLEKELGPLEKEYYQYGNKIDMKDKRAVEIDKFIAEEKSEGRAYKEIEGRYRKLLK